MAWATPLATASWPTPRWVVPRTSPSKNSSCARTSSSRQRCIVRYMARPSSRSTLAAVTSVAMRSVRVGDEQLVARELRDHARAVGGDDDLLLDARRGVAILGRAVRLEGDDHALLELDRV